MLPINFYECFAPDVKSGKKTQTIRKDRKGHRRPIKGEDLHLYVGLGTECRTLLGVGVCSEVVPIGIKRDGDERTTSIYAGDFFGFVALNESQVELLEKNNGFDSVDDFFKFFCPSPFENEFIGHIIKWDLTTSGDDN